MKWYWLIVFLYFFIPKIAYVQPIVVQVSRGNCSPNINNVNGSVEITCVNVDESTVKKINNMPSLENYNYNVNALRSLQQEVNQIGDIIKSISNNAKIGKKEKTPIENLKNDLLRKSERLDKLWIEQNNLRIRFSEEFIEIPNMIENRVEKKFIEESANLSNTLNQRIKYVSDLIHMNIRHQLEAYDLKLERIEIRIERLHNDVSFLMSEYMAGNLNKTLLFYGLSVGGNLIDDYWYSRFAGELEILIPKIQLIKRKGSVFIEIVHLDWNEEKNFKTLSGIPERKYTDSHDMTYLGIGLKLYLIKFTDEINMAIGISAGHTIAGKEDTFYYSTGGVLEYEKRNVRIALDARWESFLKIEHSDIYFNPYGDAGINSNERSDGGIYVGLRLLFR